MLMANMDLKRFEAAGGARKSRYFKRGCFLSIAEIEEAMMHHAQAPGNEVPDMLSTIHDRQDDPFLRCMRTRAIAFPVSRLQHVTTWYGLNGIMWNRHFTGSVRDISMNEEPEYLRLTWWSVDIPPERKRDARDSLYDALAEQHPAVFPHRQMILNEFANSPVFDSGSRYGNFKFSFPVEELLGAYSLQHCGGNEPVLRVLDTWMYQQEIVHTVLIHSSAHNHQFDDLPEIRGNPADPIYMNEDGGIMWRPESTSNKFTLKMEVTGENLVTVQQRPGFGVSCIWNNPVFAFHLPDEGVLEIQESSLLSSENVSVCEAIEPLLIPRGAKKSIEGAAAILASHGVRSPC